MLRTTISPQRYPSDLTDAEWTLLAPMIPPVAPGYTRTVCMREILNGIFYKLRTGCPWRYLPKDLPKWRVVYDYFERFQRNGLWEQFNHRLREQVRVAAERNIQPTAAIVDSQTVKGTEKKGTVATMVVRK
jgi:putative transposase